MHYKTQKLKITDFYFHSGLVNRSNAQQKKHRRNQLAKENQGREDAW